MHDISPTTRMFVTRMREQAEELGVVSVVLVGSKSRGFGDHRSDDDVEVFLTDAMYLRRAPSACVEQHFAGEKLMCDVRYLPLEHVQWKRASLLDTDHWPYERAQVLLDHDGIMRKTVEVLGCMGSTFRKKRIIYSTVSTTIAIGKACKALQRGCEAAGRMTVARGAKALSRILFALEWRWVPPDHWLEQDAKTLSDPARAVPVLMEALKTGDPLVLRKALEQLEETFPSDVPGREARASHYVEIVHAGQVGERALHLLL